MKTLLTLLLLIPGLSWGNNMKYLLCYNDLYELQSIGLKLNTNTKLFTSYHIKQADGEYFLNSYTSSDNRYSESADYLRLKIKSFWGFRTWGVNRKDLTWGEIPSGSIRPMNEGKCKLIDTEQNLISSLETMIEENLKRNKI